MSAAIRWSEQQLSEYQSRRGPSLAALVSGTQVMPQVPVMKKEPAKYKAASDLEIKFELQLRAAGIRMPWAQYDKAIPGRKFRIDFAYPDPDVKLAIEIEGAVHRIRERFNGDLEKHSLLAIHGWRLLRIGREQITSGEGIQWVIKALEGTC